MDMDPQMQTLLEILLEWSQADQKTPTADLTGVVSGRSEDPHSTASTHWRPYWSGLRPIKIPRQQTLLEWSQADQKTPTTAQPPPTTAQPPPTADLTGVVSDQKTPTAQPPPTVAPASMGQYQQVMPSPSFFTQMTPTFPGFYGQMTPAPSFYSQPAPDPSHHPQPASAPETSNPKRTLKLTKEVGLQQQ